MTGKDTLKWFGYLRTDGTTQVKEYKNAAQYLYFLKENHFLIIDFTIEFNAPDKDSALEIAKKELNP